MSFAISNTFVALQRNALISLWAFGLFLGAIADFLVGSPGDATLLLAAFVVSVAGMLMLKEPNGALAQRLTSLWPAVNERLLAAGMFAISAALVFAKIAEDVAEHESPHLDFAVSFWVHQFSSPTLDILMRAITSLARFSTVALFAVFILTFCWRKRDAAAAAALVGVIALDEGLKLVLKNTFDRPRPSWFAGIPTHESYSFPSGHSMAAVAIWGMMAVVLCRLTPALRPWAYWGVFILALLIGYSRIYLGAHWLTDVLGGYAAGAAVLSAGVLWLEANPSTAAPAPRT